ncbi:MAG: polysaccharide deacetylase family protein [Paracoccaceae bacterium]|nr:polysaccharide deacetylase family protein [Paracoccaceae bacterium]
MTMKTRGLAALLTALILAAPAPAQDQPATPVNGLVYLIETHPEAEIDGLLRWELELRERGLTAMIKASTPVLETYPEVFRRLAEEGHEIIGGYAGICWDKPYDEQLEAMASVKTYMEGLTARPMRVFACSYSSYDENTMRAAEALGVPFVLARGTEDVRALIYRPEEYDVGIIEVSNVAFGELGRGSLCDISLYSRGATEVEFAQVLEESIAKAPDSMILVSHPHIGGTKRGYWSVYEAALDDPEIDWAGFDDWIGKVTVDRRAYAGIPENRELEYLEPQPAVPLDELENLPAVGEKIVMFHNGLGPMCREAEAFLDRLDYPVEEHLVGERSFLDLLERYRVQFEASEGVSAAFEYFPLIFVGGRAFSGFNTDVRAAIEAEISR